MRRADEPIGCDPESWTNYRKVGCTLDSNGDCCICVEGYSVISISPLICEYMPYCLEYIQEDNKNARI